MLIQFTCPHCQQVLELESIWAGHPVACPSCGAQVTAPAPQALLAAKVPVSTPPRRTPTGPGDHKVRGGGGGFFKLLLLMFLLTAGGFLYYCYSTHQAPAVAWQQGVDLARQYLSPAPPPAPAPAPKPIPAPVVAAPAPKPAPATNVVIVAPPPPPPPPPDPLAWISEAAKKQPLEVSLLEDKTFPILYGGKVVGSGNVPHGDALQIVSIDDQAKQVTLSCAAYGGSTVTVPIAATDLLQRAPYLKEEIQGKEAEVKTTSSPLPAAAAPAAPAAPEKTPQAPAPNAGAFTATPSPQPAATPYGTAAPPEPSDQVQIQETITNGFRHPGIGLTKAILENARAQIIAKREPWYSAYVAMAADSKSGLSVSSSNQSKTDPSRPDDDAFVSRAPLVWRLIGDSDKAYRQALMYYFTGNPVYHANGMKIIRIWSQLDPQKFRSFPEDHIHACYPVEHLIQAAELLRYTSSPGDASSWTDQDTEAFTKNFVVPCRDTFFSKNGWFMNQAGYPITAAMASDIFSDNRDDYATRVEWFTVNKDAPNKGWSFSIKDLARLVDTNAITKEKVATPQVQLMEMGRDQAHAGDDMDILMNVARMMNAQGTKVDPVDGTISTKPNAVGPYEFLDDRILAAADYFCRFMLGYDTPWIPVPYDIGPGGEVRTIYPRIADNYRGRIREIEFWDAYYYYTYQKGVNLAEKAPYYNEAFSKRILNSNAEWVYVPPQASGEAAKSPQPQQEPTVVEIAQRSAHFDDHASVLSEDGASFVRVTPAELGTRVALLSMGTSQKTIQLRVRTTGPADLAVSGFAQPWSLPDTQGQWRYVSYTMSPLEQFRDIEYFTLKGAPSAQADLGELIRDGKSLKPAPAFKDGTGELNLVAYVGAPIALDFSPVNAGDTPAVNSLDKPEGSALDSSTGAFSWTPRLPGDYHFSVNLASGEAMSAKRVHLRVTPDRATALHDVTSAYDSKIEYVRATADKYQASLAETNAASAAGDDVFFAKLAQLQKDSAALEPLTPLLPDGSMNYPGLVASSTMGDFIALLTDGNSDTWVSTNGRTYTLDFGPQFRFSATAFALQGRLNFEDRARGITFWGSNDSQNWTQLTASLDDLPTKLMRLEVKPEEANVPFRYLKIEKASGSLFEPSEVRIYGQRHETQ